MEASGKKTVDRISKSEQTVKIAGDSNSWDPQVMEKKDQK